MWGTLDHCLASQVLAVPMVPAGWTQAGNKTAGASLWSLGLTWLLLPCRAAWPWRSPPPAKGVLVAVWRGGSSGVLWTGGTQAKRAQGSPGRGRGSAGRLASRPSPQLLEDPQGWLCLPVAMVPAGGCVTSRLGSRQTVVCGLKGPGGPPEAASHAPEEEVHGVSLSSPLPAPPVSPGT